MEKYNENKFEKVNLNEFKINEIGIDIFYFSTTIFILSRLKQKQFIKLSSKMFVCLYLKIRIKYLMR